MKPLFVMLIVFVLAVAINKFAFGDYHLALSGRISLSAMLVFSAIGHFVFTKGMSLMLPNFVPFKSALVYVTGFIEILFAIAIFFPNYRMLTAWLIIAFLIVVLPTNIYAAIKQLDYQKATFNGNGIKYLWFRIPLQIFFIVWTYFSTIYY